MSARRKIIGLCIGPARAGAPVPREIVDIFVLKPAAPRSHAKWVAAARKAASNKRCAFFAVKNGSAWRLYRTDGGATTLNSFPSEDAAAMWMMYRAGTL